MDKSRYCRQCGTKFTYSRDDQQFCTPKCVAQFYRDNPNPEYIHAANMDEFWHECENCHVEYFVNGYAQRGGKRAPKYCSVKCKQAAYRVRKQEVQDQAARRNTVNVGNKSSSNDQSSRRTNNAPPPPPPNPKAPPPPKWNYVGTNRRDPLAVDEARGILGLRYQDYDDSDVRKAYKREISRWHPDRNPSPFATAWSQAINWAYGCLKH